MTFKWQLGSKQLRVIVNKNRQTAAPLAEKGNKFLRFLLAREYQAVIAYVVYSQVIKGAAYMNIAAELEKHAQEELGHALIIAKQIDYLGGMPTVTALRSKPLTRPRTYFALIWTMRTKRFAVIVSGYASASP
jgi:hypothetical protein